MTFTPRPRRIPEIHHGTRSAYQYWDCRCPSCTFAETVYQNKKKGRKTFRRKTITSLCNMLLDAEKKGLETALNILEDDFGVGAPVTRKINFQLKRIQNKLA